MCFNVLFDSCCCKFNQRAWIPCLNSILVLIYCGAPSTWCGRSEKKKGSTPPWIWFLAAAPDPGFLVFVFPHMMLCMVPCGFWLVVRTLGRRLPWWQYKDKSHGVEEVNCYFYLYLVESSFCSFLLGNVMCVPIIRVRCSPHLCLLPEAGVWLLPAEVDKFLPQVGRVWLEWGL